MRAVLDTMMLEGLHPTADGKGATYYYFNVLDLRVVWLPPHHVVPWHKHSLASTVTVHKGSGHAGQGDPAEEACQILFPGAVMSVDADEWHTVVAEEHGLLLSEPIAGNRITTWLGQ